MRRPSRRRVLLLTPVVAVIAALVGVVGVRLLADPPARMEQLRVPGVPEAGAPVELDAALYRPPSGSGPWPAVMLAHGYGGSRDDLDGEARRLAGAGYLVLTWTARGFGRSQGLIHLDSPDYEVADARLLLDRLAARPDVARDGAGDPTVGVAGASYGGAVALLLAGTDPRVDAIAPQITWNDLRRALFPQAVLPEGAGEPGTAAAPAPAPGVGSGVFKKGWAGVFFGPRAGATPAAGDASADGAAGAGDEAERPGAQNSLCGRLAEEVCQAYLEVAATGRATPRMLDLLAASSPARVLSRISAPTLIVQGEADSLFPLGEGDANAAGIAANGTPVKLVWTGGGHDGGPDERDRVRALTLDWFDTHLRGAGAGDTRFEATVGAAAISSDDSNPEPLIRAAPGAPGVNRDAQPVVRQRIALTGAEQAIVSPAGGWPAAVTALPGAGIGGLSVSAAPGSLASPAGQVAMFDSAPLASRVQLVGSGSVRLRVWSSTGEATLFVSLQDASPYGPVRLPGGLVSPLRLAGIPEDGTEVTVALPAVVRDIATGHRLRLAVSATDQAYAVPQDARSYRVELVGGAVSVPTVAMTVLDAGGLTRLLPWALALVAATGLIVGAGIWRGRRVARLAPSAELVEVPLAVAGLGKAYGNGFRAVRDVSMRVEQGWVLGLLGPNGAGKTTVLRMLMGLIRPTEGELRVFGHLVAPGAPVLSRVGAFVEGPGFLPHVSGLDNLRLYWAATGRPDREAFFEEALEVAGLGADVQRTVRTYSQGMRQRLAIAQAMLGLPDLLVLDEPTNGLDPPQIREMREVLTRYAATGRTVVVSSHLLAEVEQTCSHVVVMHQGSVVAAGVVSDLVGSATALVVDVDDPERAAAVAEGLPGARDVRQTPSGLTLELVGVPRSALVRTLVEAGLSVERIAPRRGLEEAFLALVGES